MSVHREPERSRNMSDPRSRRSPCPLYDDFAHVLLPTELSSELCEFRDTQLRFARPFNVRPAEDQRVPFSPHGSDDFDRTFRPVSNDPNDVTILFNDTDRSGKLRPTFSD